MVTRRAWGYVEQLPSGNYRASHLGADGRRVGKTFATASGADEWLTLGRSSLLTGTAGRGGEDVTGRRASEPKRGWYTVRLRCRGCGRIVRAFVPKGGDRTGFRPFKHPGSDGEDCRGQYEIHDSDDLIPEDVGDPDSA
ncbi:MAG: hypothetical protein JWO62_1614 [Acidimicrobiaceae bacterium]|jgi:hypothetical protein|nr:hypothetical protein [Acidimicrobiaceae bacterium]